MLGIDHTHLLSAYLRALFIAEMQGNSESVKIPSTWPLDLVEECHYVIRLVIRAIGNQKRTKWSVIDYVADLKRHGVGHREEKRRLKLFPPCTESELIKDATLVVDANGIILLWYLPGLCSRKRQLLVWTLLKKIEGRLRVKYGSSSWRVNEQYFRSEPGFEYRPGTVSYALAWFQQAMATKLDMEVSAELRHPESAGHQWLTSMQDTTAFLGSIVSIINPAIFTTGLQCIDKIRQNPHRVAKRENLDDLLEIWTSPYTSGSIMSNRDSPLHRDSSGGYSTMDVLLSVGNYVNGRFQVPGLGFELLYNSGTVIGIVGRVLMHGATSSGERVCYAQWNKENVLDALDIPQTEWMNINDLLYSFATPSQ